jgi:hypothetical protein
VAAPDRPPFLAPAAAPGVAPADLAAAGWDVMAWTPDDVIERGVIELPPAAYAKVLDLIANPPAPTPALVALMRGEPGACASVRPAPPERQESRPDPRPGDRVGALLKTEPGRAWLLGFGVYDGDFPVAETAAGELAEVARGEGWDNPRITLDDGRVVWGCECWWAPEAEIRAELAGCEVIAADIDVERAWARGEG